jgi:hypothetical protein
MAVQYTCPYGGTVDTTWVATPNNLDDNLAAKICRVYDLSALSDVGNTTTSSDGVVTVVLSVEVQLLDEPLACWHAAQPFYVPASSILCHTILTVTADLEGGGHRRGHQPEALVLNGGGGSQCDPVSGLRR